MMNINTTYELDTIIQLQENFEDTKGVIRSHKSKKDRQYKIHQHSAIISNYWQQSKRKYKRKMPK
jgi:hypothetical protein